MYRQEYEIIYRDRIKDVNQSVYFSSFDNNKNEKLPDSTLITKKGIVKDLEDRFYPLIFIQNKDGSVTPEIMDPVDLFTHSEVADMIACSLDSEEVDVDGLLNDTDISRSVAFQMRAKTAIRLGEVSPTA